YRKSEIAGLPQALQTHSNVHFVVQEERQEPRGSEGTRATEQARKIAGPDDTIDGQTLSAKRVIERISTGLKLEAPPLMRDPLGFMADWLRTSLLQVTGDEAEHDVYAIKEVVERVERAARWEREGGPRSVLPDAAAIESPHDSVDVQL